MEESVQADLEGGEKVSPETAKLGGKEIQAVTGEEEVESVLGWIAVYTIGPKFTVDRSWLLEQAGDLGISENMMPSEVSPRRAYTRAAKRVADTVGIVPEGVEASTTRADYSTFQLEITDRREDGEINSEIIGELKYDDGGVYSKAKSSNGEYLDYYQRYAQEFTELHEEMMESNTGKDIRAALRKFIQNDSTSVKMRSAGAVYFVPAHYDQMVSAWKELINRINSTWKDSGHASNVDLIEVIDSPAKRDMVERKVRNSLEQTVEGIVESALDEFDEEAAANEFVANLADDLSSAQNMAVEHNTLLNADISVRKSLESWKSRVGEDNEELVSKLVEEVDV